jgi:hypothetical protein
MKASEFKKLIREEIQKVLKESKNLYGTYKENQSTLHTFLKSKGLKGKLNRTFGLMYFSNKQLADYLKRNNLDYIIQSKDNGNRYAPEVYVTILDVHSTILSNAFRADENPKSENGATTFIF